MTRFKIVYVNRAYKPWELHEWVQSNRWFTRGHWVEIASGDSETAMQTVMRQKVEGAIMYSPTYYDHTGKPEPAF